MAIILPTITPLNNLKQKPATMAATVKPPSPTSPRGRSQYLLIYRILQFIFVVVVFVHFIRHQAPCTANTATKNANTNELRSKHSRYINPLSNRVPANGIETILATSATKPPFHFFAHSTKNDWLTAQIIRTGIYEKDSTTALIDEIVCKPITSSKPLLVLDLGANIGFHSLHMAACGARVVSFEASPDTAWLLRSSAKLNEYYREEPSLDESNTLTLIPRGVSNATGTARLSRYPQSPGMTSFVSSQKTSFKFEAGAKGSALDVDIPLVRAQDVLKELQVTPDRYNLRFLKLDVEGFEFQALQGLDLKQYPFQYLTLEFFPSLLKAGGTDPAELLVYIWNQGYRYLEFDVQKKLEDYDHTNTGTTEAAVRSWAQKLVKNGYESKKDGYHINLLTQRIR